MRRQCGHFPDQPRHAEFRAWTPKYRTEKGTEYEIDEAESDECPVTAVTAESWMIAALLMEERQIRDASGASLFGPVSGDWPAWWSDAAVVDEVYRKIEHNARARAELSEIQRHTP